MIAVENRRVFPYLIGVTALTAVATGLVAHLIDRKDFPTFGIGVWWAVVTLGTVGYGDVVPHTAWGRLLGSVVIVCGVTFISFLIAIVTSSSSMRTVRLRKMRCWHVTTRYSASCERWTRGWRSSSGAAPSLARRADPSTADAKRYRRARCARLLRRDA